MLDFFVMKQGFTVVEIVIVMIVSSIMMSALIPRVFSSYGNMYDLQRVSNLSTLYNGLGLHYAVNEYFFSVALCSDVLQQQLGTYLTNPMTDPQGHKIDTCDGHYKYLPLRDADGGILIAEVELQKNANFIYPGGLNDITMTAYQAGECNKGSCGSAPWYHAMFIKGY